MSSPAPGAAAGLPPVTRWLVLTVAAIGFLFDTYELLMFPVIGSPAVAELLNVEQTSDAVRQWGGRMLWIAALCGGVFGLLGGIGNHPEDVAHMKRTADRLFGDQFRWSVLGAGASQLRIAAQAAALGGNIRVGLEDSLWAGKGKLATSNAEQVALARKIIEGLGMQVATPDEAREILELKGGDKVAF